MDLLIFIALLGGIGYWILANRRPLEDWVRVNNRRRRRRFD